MNPTSFKASDFSRALNIRLPVATMILYGLEALELAHQTMTEHGPVWRILSHKAEEFTRLDLEELARKFKEKKRHVF